MICKLSYSEILIVKTTSNIQVLGLKKHEMCRLVSWENLSSCANKMSTRGTLKRMKLNYIKE